jgi:membrane protease YdiL (CAAX protease family)
MATDQYINENKKNKYLSIPLAIGMAGIFLGVWLVINVFAFLLAKYGKINRDIIMLFEAVMLYGISFFICYIIRRKRAEETSVKFSFSNAKIIPYTIFVSLIITWVIANPITELIPMPDIMKEGLKNLNSSTNFAMFLFMVILAPLGEELIFRGIILDSLLKRYSSWKAIIVSALIFGAVHLNPWQFIPGFALGIFFGWIYYHTQRNILQTFILHAVVNLSSFATHFLGEKYKNADSSAYLFGGWLNYCLFIAGGIVVGSICVWLLHKRFLNEKIEAE